MPPAVRNAGSEIPNAINRPLPTTAKGISTIEAIRMPLTAVLLRRSGEYDTVRAAKTAATSSGPTVAKKVAKATPAVSNMAGGSLSR